MKKRFLTASLILFFLSVCALFILKHNPPRYIFLITLDTTRGDFINHSSSPGNKLTPHFAELSASGVCFSNAYSMIPITLPAHATMFYSLPPNQLKIYNNGQVRSLQKPPLAWILQKNGYRTGAVISLGVLMKKFGLNKGFNTYIDEFKPYLYYKTAAEVNREAFRLINDMASEPSFFWIHYSDPHEPYYPPYLKGRFSILFNSRKLIDYRLFAQPRVTIKLTLQPGDNVLSVKISKPSKFPEIDTLPINYIKYENVRIGPEGAEANLEIKLPRTWGKRRTPRNSWHLYDNGGGKTEINLFNRSQKAMTVSVSFVLKVMVAKNIQKYFYRQQIKYMDRHFGKLVSFLKKKNMFKDCLFVVVGDHGEGLGEYRGHFGHIHYLHKPYTRVPLIVSGKGIKKRGKIRDPVSIMDVAPTILQQAGIDIPEYMAGLSLFREGKGRQLFLETHRPEAVFDSFSLISLPHQMIVYPGKRRNNLELYDVSEGAGGMENLIHDNRYATVKAKLLTPLLRRSRRILKTKKKMGTHPNRFREMLETLGYF